MAPDTTLPGLSEARCDNIDWLSSEGIERVRSIVSKRVPYEPSSFQLQNTARLLNGQDVLCVTATGDGKTALIYMYTMVREGSIAVVLSPTNSLEADMVNNLSKLGISALAINAETTAAAARSSPSRDIWEEAASGKYSIIFCSPETLRTLESREKFHAFVNNPDVRARLGLFVVDECHLVDEWREDFRKAYAQIKDVHPWLPPSTVMLALTATLEPGRQTTRVIDCLGLSTRPFHFKKRDCERHNISIIFRTIRHAVSGTVFRDLDWLVPADHIENACDIPKTLVYCETIELGHRVARYL
ncbi:P-loop containing nucleoside triphosphate hydrolase protein, partial [Panus rudis PR-1116 ss-1]